MSLDGLTVALAEPIRMFGRPTPAGRLERRASATLEELRAFHALLTSHLEAIIEASNRYPLDAIPARYRALADAVLASCEIDDPLHQWSAPALELCSDPCTRRTKTSWDDYRRAIPPGHRAPRGGPG
jgi:hypothetical protein